MIEYGDLLSPEIRAQMVGHEATEAVLRPLRVAAAREWPPLHQLLVDSGIAKIIEEKTGTEFPRINITNRLIQYGQPASAWPREETVDISSAVSHAPELMSNPLAGGWTVAIVLWPQPDGGFDSTLRIQASGVLDWKSTQHHMYEGYAQTVNFEIDQDRNLRVIGAEETFNGSVDHLNKRGLQRVKTAINKAFRKPMVSAEHLGMATLGAA